MFSYSLLVAIFDRAFAVFMWAVLATLVGVPVFVLLGDWITSAFLGAAAGYSLARVIWKSERLRVSRRHGRL